MHRIALLLLVLPVVPASAQDNTLTTDPVLSAVSGRAGQFLDSVATGQVQNAYQELLTGSLLAKQADAVKTLVIKTSDLETKYGRSRGNERIGVRRVGSDLVLLKYLYKCESCPVVWYFSFYRVPAPAGLSPDEDAWRVVSVRFDTELDALWY